MTDEQCINVINVGGSGGMLPQKKIWLSEIASEPNATRTTPPVVSAACEFGTLRLLLSQMLLELLTCSFCSL